jgi:tuberous sclerosis protein 2
MPHPTNPPQKHPTDIAIALYLAHLSNRLKSISLDVLTSILPILFRALAFYASPLPRLTVMARKTATATACPAERITEILDSLLSGPYSTSCMSILKHHLFPPTILPSLSAMQTLIQISIGAHRTLRNYIRKGLCTRLARAYISRESSLGYSYSGAPGHMDVERELMERAWPKDEVSGWDAGRLGPALHKSVEAWVTCEFAWDGAIGFAREKILDEAAGTLKDIFQELDSREAHIVLEDEEACAVGETLHQLAKYIDPLRFATSTFSEPSSSFCLRNPDNSPFIIPLTEPMEAPTPFLRTLSFLLSRDHATYLNPLLSTTLLALADHLTDADTAKLPIVMSEHHDLSPTSPDWLTNWELLLRNRTLLHGTRILTRNAVVSALRMVYGSVKDMPGYRKPLADLVWESCQRLAGDPDREYDDNEALWRILGDEIVLRTVEDDEADDSAAIESFLELLRTVAAEAESEDDTDAASIATTDTHSPSLTSSTVASNVVSPILSRMQSEHQGGVNKDKDKDSALPSVMSLLSSFTTGSTSRSQSVQPQLTDETPGTPDSSPQLEAISIPRAVGAVVALIAVFTQLSFTPHALSEKSLPLAIQVYDILINLLVQGKSARIRLTVLQFLMRLRADRDHRLYYIDAAYDPDGHVLTLASLIHRVWDPLSSVPPRYEPGNDEHPPADNAEYRKARTRTPQARDGRQSSRGRGGRPSRSGTSRSRSRATNVPILAPSAKPREPIWRLPESLPFVGPEVDTPSEALISYDPNGPGNRLVLPMSNYLFAVVQILEREWSWDILSYVLCHLPVQLANKHLFCGPKSREGVVRILATLCDRLLNGDFASEVDRWPLALKARDAHGLAYHTLSVLISYQRYADVKLRHALVEVFLNGLDGQPSTIKCCLHALSLSAFELQTSMTKYLSKILERLSRIMSNPEMAVHILGFLSIVGSLRPLHANFTEGDYKMVFGVALQYLQHHNQPGSSPTSSWALSQHVRILSYYIVYVWFLALHLPDRPRHVKFIIRQLLFANQGKPEVDEPTEVCFDWLARFAYASADPRPANSLLSDIVMDSPAHGTSSDISLCEKAWISGNSILTIRTLPKLGWVEVLIRRPSGFTKFLCRVENVPMVGSGDVDPDLMSGPASLLMERDIAAAQAPDAMICAEFPAQLQVSIHT